MMLRGNSLPRTPASATPFANRNVNVNNSFADENNHATAGDFVKPGATKTPLTIGKLGGGGGDHQQQQQRRRVALGDISNRKPTALQQQQQPHDSTIKSTTKKNSVVLSSAANKIHASQKQPTAKRVNFSSSLLEPSLETATKPRVLFSAPTPIPKRHLFHDELLLDDEDDEEEADGDYLNDPVEDMERPAGRLWSAEEHGFGDSDDPRDDISLEEGSRHFMEDVRAFVQESRIQGIHDQVRQQEEESRHYMEHTFSRILEEQYKSDLAALDNEPMEFLEDHLDLLTLDYCDDVDDITHPTFYAVGDISF